MERFSYENKLANQNITAKVNVAWVADITYVELLEGQKLYIFLCNDIHTNKIICSTTGKRITAKSIVRCLKQAINDRFLIVPRQPVILHTDRGTQFTGKLYYEFTKEFEKFIIPSMSRRATPKDNPVSERFMRTFKEHKLEDKTIQEYIFQELEKGPIKSYKKIVNKYVASLNQSPNSKTFKESAERHDTNVSAASMLMVDPIHTKAFSPLFGDDIRRGEVEKFKAQNSEVISILEELASKKAEIVDRTPFDDFEDNLALQLIDQRLSELYALIQTSPEVTRKYVEEAIEPVTESLEKIDKKIDILLPKRKSLREVLPLRDPLDLNLYPQFMASAGNSFKQQHELKRAQLRVTYTILYYGGFRLNEIRFLTQEQIKKAIDSSQFSLIHFKTNKPHIHVLSKKAVQELKNLKLEYSIIFDKYKYKFLYGKEEPVNNKSLIRFVNRDLKHTSKALNIPYNIRSHSFRINFISSLLKVTSVQNTADIIGHDDIRSTMYYKRYALSKNEIQDLLEKINNNNIN
jgi:integrase/transposase InsO family protein